MTASARPYDAERWAQRSALIAGAVLLFAVLLPIRDQWPWGAAVPLPFLPALLLLPLCAALACLAAMKRVNPSRARQLLVCGVGILVAWIGSDFHLLLYVPLAHLPRVAAEWGWRELLPAVGAALVWSGQHARAHGEPGWPAAVAALLGGLILLTVLFVPVDRDESIAAGWFHGASDGDLYVWLPPTVVSAFALGLLGVSVVLSRLPQRRLARVSVVVGWVLVGARATGTLVFISNARPGLLPLSELERIHLGAQSALVLVSGFVLASVGLTAFLERRLPSPHSLQDDVIEVFE